MVQIVHRFGRKAVISLPVSSWPGKSTRYMERKYYHYTQRLLWPVQNICEFCLIIFITEYWGSLGKVLYCRCYYRLDVKFWSFYVLLFLWNQEHWLSLKQLVPTLIKIVEEYARWASFIRSPFRELLKVYYLLILVNKLLLGTTNIHDRVNSECDHA